MASIFRRTYKAKLADGRTVEKTVAHYTIQFRDATGRLRRVKGYKDKGATIQKAAKLEKAAARGEQDLADPYAAHRKTPLGQHLDDYLSEMQAIGRDDMHRYLTRKRLDKLFKACGWTLPGDIEANAFCRWREKRAADPKARAGPRTLNQYLEILRTFCRWMIKRNRMGADPVANVEKLDGRSDVRRARRALTADQVAAFLAAVPEDARRVYRFILSTGLRRQEVNDLQWGDVRLDSPTPFLRLRAKATKARRADTLPMRADLAAELRQLRGDAADADKVFPDGVPSMYRHRQYLTKAGIPWQDDDGRRADVHALRHTYGTLLSKAGVSPREAMELMRHRDMRLTMKVYTDPRIFDLSGAVERLPLPPADKPQAQQATGTNGTPSLALTHALTQTPALDSHSVSQPGTNRGAVSAAKPLEHKGERHTSAHHGTGGHSDNRDGNKGAATIQSGPDYRENPRIPAATDTSTDTRPSDAGLNRLVRCWPSLPRPVRDAILGLLPPAE